MGLSTIALEVRIIIKWVLIGLASLLLLWVVFLVTRALYRALQPPKKAVPTIAFGRLPSPIAANANLRKVEIDIDTPDGVLPSFPELLEVYPIPEPTGKVNSLDVAGARARNLDVSGSPKSLSPTLYQWQDAKLPNRTVTIDIVNLNYNYRYDWIADSKVLAKSFPAPVHTQAEILAKGFFARDFKGTNDLEKGEVESYYVRVSGNDRSRVSSASEANAVEVSVFREKILGKYGVVGFDPSKSLMNALVVPQSNEQILEANFIHWLVDFKSSSTYPLRSTAQAFEDLKAGKAYIVSGRLDNLDRIKIVDVKLVYLETKEYSPYLQPIYVFSGDSFAGKQKSSFVAYLPAVAEPQLKSSP